jgi:hypothetical protein
MLVNNKRNDAIPVIMYIQNTKWVRIILRPPFDSAIEVPVSHDVEIFHRMNACKFDGIEGAIANLMI